MDLSIAQSDPDRVATEVGVITAVLGTALLAAPVAVGRRGWIADPRQARVLGAVDVVIATGLLARRPRAPWMAARAVATVGTAAFFARIARSGPPTVGPAVLAGALLAAAVVDVAVTRELFRDGR